MPEISGEELMENELPVWLKQILASNTFSQQANRFSETVGKHLDAHSLRYFWYFKKRREDFSGWKHNSEFRVVIWVKKRNHNDLAMKIMLFILPLSGGAARYVGAPCSITQKFTRENPQHKSDSSQPFFYLFF